MEILWCYAPPEHDKIYKLWITKQDGAWTVWYAHGRRGAVLKPKVMHDGIATAVLARTILCDMHNNKLRKGYRNVTLECGGDPSRLRPPETGLPRLEDIVIPPDDQPKLTAAPAKRRPAFSEPAPSKPPAPAAPPVEWNAPRPRRMIVIDEE